MGIAVARAGRSGHERSVALAIGVVTDRVARYHRSRVGRLPSSCVDVRGFSPLGSSFIPHFEQAVA
jgi:hypothetical protein